MRSRHAVSQLARVGRRTNCPEQELQVTVAMVAVALFFTAAWLIVRYSGPRQCRPRLRLPRALGSEQCPGLPVEVDLARSKQASKQASKGL